MVKFLIPIFFIIIAHSSLSQREQILEWVYSKQAEPEWKVYRNCGSIQEKLMLTGELRTPYFLNNEDSLQRIEKEKWELLSGFLISSEEMNQDLWLFLPSVDTYAEVFVNDRSIGKTNNAFRPYYFKINDVVEVGENLVKILFTPPILFHEENGSDVSFYPAPNDVGDIKVASITRKPQYQFGWDWTMRMNTIGLNSPAKLIISDGFEVVNSGVQTTAIDLNTKRATLEFKINCAETIAENIFWESERFGTLKTTVKDTELSSTIHQDDVEYWWPRGQGEAKMYEDIWKLYNSENQLIKVLKVKYGVRISELIQERDSIGINYQIQLNDRNIFCKGANYIPPSVFVAEIDSARIKQDVETMLECNFNMIRVWGGGIYLPDYFYHVCDSLGIMIWQDFMFACALYPADEAFKTNVAEEISYQVRRLSSHPSVVLFNGNNEVEVAYEFWGLKDALSINEENWLRLEEEKDELFKKFIPQIVADNSHLPYVFTSPLSNWGLSERFNSGSQHYWGVWHGSDDPFEGFTNNIGRFNSEFGYQSFPQTSTLLSFTSIEDLNLNSDIMQIHQKSYVGNEKILNHIKQHYRKPKNFHDFVYLSQLLQADAISAAIVAHRLAVNRCAGSLYWQFNDCFPGPTWSGIDYYGNWKALQYAIRDDFKDQTVLQNTEGEYYWINDSPDTSVIDLTITAMRAERIQKNFSIQFTSIPHQAIQLYLNKKTIKSLTEMGGKLSFSWREPSGDTVQGSFIYSDNQRNLTPPKYEVFSYNPESREGYIRLKIAGIVQDLWIEDLEGLSEFNQNFLDLLPGEYLIKFKRPKEPVHDDFYLSWN